MNDNEFHKFVQEELNNIAPEVDMASVDPAADLREALDIVSTDFLNFITAVHHRLGVDIPEIDHPKLITLNGAVAYLAEHLKWIKNRGAGCAELIATARRRSSQSGFAIASIPARWVLYLSAGHP